MFGGGGRCRPVLRAGAASGLACRCARSRAPAAVCRTGSVPVRLDVGLPPGFRPAASPSAAMLGAPTAAPRRLATGRRRRSGAGTGAERPVDRFAPPGLTRGLSARHRSSGEGRRRGLQVLELDAGGREDHVAGDVDGVLFAGVQGV